MLIVGLDWSRCKHDVVFMQPNGQVVHRGVVTHNAQGLNCLARRIAERQPAAAQVRVAIEMHDGALLAWLLAQGYTVFGINPKSAQRARDRYRPAGGKDDASDAFILADMLRTDHGTLRAIYPDSHATAELRAMVELRATRVQDRTALFHRLRALLAEWCPDLSKLCDDLTRHWQRDLLHRFPLQQDLHQAHSRTTGALVRRHRLGKDTAERIEQTRRAATLPVPAALQQTLRLNIQGLLDQIQLLNYAIKQLDQLIQQQVDQHPDAQVFQTLPVKGTNTIAHLLAGFGEDRHKPARHTDLAAAWGVAPLTIQSGKYRSVKRRFAADHTMNQALLHFAFNTAFTADCWAAEFYKRKRLQGTAHYTTLRCLAQRWLKILFRMWMDRTDYDEQLHRTNQARRRSAHTFTSTPG